MGTLVKRGHKGFYVVDIQRRLNNEKMLSYSVYPDLIEDGAFGKATKARVEEWQMLHPPLKIDGLVGPNTWAALFHGAAMPVAVKSAADIASKAQEQAKAESERPKNFRDFHDRVPANYYIHTVGTAGIGSAGFLHRGQNNAECVIPYIGSIFAVKDRMREVADDNEILIQDLVINCHGGGSGRLIIGNGNLVMGNTSNSLFAGIKPLMLPGYKIFITACNFAAADDDDKSDSEKKILEWEDVQYGQGTMRMVGMAKHFKRTVRAGFGMQFGDLTDFSTPWAEAHPDGQVLIYAKGRTLKFGEAVTYFYDQHLERARRLKRYLVGD